MPLTSNHWGIGCVQVENGRIASVDPHPADPEPSPINGNIASSLNGQARVLRPAVRKGWLENGPGPSTRGEEPFVEVGWDTVIDLLADELKRVRETHGNNAIFAGSYGWSSAGRFHHAQSQLKRFLNTQGGFVRSEGNYSYNAALGLMPFILGPFRKHVAQATRWSVIAEHSELVVLFGGLAMRNAQVSDGGIAQHRLGDNLAKCAREGVRFVNFSPLRSDVLDGVDAEWIAPLPGTDVAVMMGIAHTLLDENLHDQKFLDRYTVGFDQLAAYLRGETDGIAKTPEWAAERSGIPAAKLRLLAREMAAKRTMISCAASLQRADYGEQPLWMTVSLAAMLGQVGLPGGGFTIGYGVNGNIGNIERLFRPGALPQGQRRIPDFIPVSMISEMLLHPGQDYTYLGQKRTLPNAKMVWWAGGNPFHHHQDLNRLRRAFATPDTIVVNEINWTATARHADIVLPVAAPQERTDFGAGKSDNALIPMPVCATPPGDARTEFDIYCDLSRRLGNVDDFSEGLDEHGWLTRLWEETRTAANEHGIQLPDWDTFISGDVITLPDPSPNQVFLADYRAEPDKFALPTPSGRIELHCQTIAEMKLPDCLGHASWFEPRDWAAANDRSYPLALVSGQPGTRLHSQLDNGATSVASKINQREPVLIHPKDAAKRDISDGDIVELYNARGRCLAGARVTEDIREGCVFLWTGAWYDPDFSNPDQRDRHGNPNVLTHDHRTSSLTQSTAAHSTNIEIRLPEGSVPAVQAHAPPRFTFADTSATLRKTASKV
ncbi:molybdopterin-dependent oxidoreductase [uncultured Roseibium sp.]|uniref:molybdopterin-dependent oxidoreductase n=1 Tax=uncultured Roseibium sp. TaxID=1936171 RepID=UPI002633221B|nr:molybdopterin-dependent oxidoreductase [uncultured Roseibium sp.]